MPKCLLNNQGKSHRLKKLKIALSYMVHTFLSFKFFSTHFALIVNKNQTLMLFTTSQLNPNGMELFDVA